MSRRPHAAARRPDCLLVLVVGAILISAIHAPASATIRRTKSVQSNVICPYVTREIPEYVTKEEIPEYVTGEIREYVTGEIPEYVTGEIREYVTREIPTYRARSNRACLAGVVPAD